MKQIDNLVSVIIRTKDRPVFLQRAIDSVCSQTYKNIEVVIVNDGGKSVVDIVKHYESIFLKSDNAPKRKFIYIENSTSVRRANAANIGIEASSGKYACLLDDDDYFYTQHIERHVEAQEKNKAVLSISRACEAIEDENGKEKIKKYNYLSDQNRLMFYFFENYYPSNSLVFQKSLIKKVGGFDKNLQVLEDWDLWIRMFMETEPVIIDEITCVYTTRNGASNVRMSFEAKDMWKKSFEMVMNKYKGVYDDKKVNIPLSEIDKFLSSHAVDWYKMTKENEELRDSFAYRIYNSRTYRIAKKIGRLFKSTRG